MRFAEPECAARAADVLGEPGDAHGGGTVCTSHEVEGRICDDRVWKARLAPECKPVSPVLTWDGLDQPEIAEWAVNQIVDRLVGSFRRIHPDEAVDILLDG